MKLIDVYGLPSAPLILWELLRERKPNESISHQKMPTWDEHQTFVASKPYPHWYIIMVGEPVGSVYLTDRNEVGVSIYKAHRGHRYATQAIQQLLDMHPGKALANINPLNLASIALFEKLGFKHIQNTYAK